MKHLQLLIKTMSGTYPDTYFAGANTADGFRSDYSNYIQEEALTRLYILKGGSGTGKSTLIHRCAKEAASAGASVTMLLCSSDPSSADGALITGSNGAKIGILDGTAPHVLDPVLPGVSGVIVNLGDFWDKTTLASFRGDIQEHTRKKQTAYNRAYRYLAAYGEIQMAVRELLTPCLLIEKMQGAAKRFVSKLPKEKAGGELFRRTAAVTMHGLCQLETFRSTSEIVWNVQDIYGSSAFLLEAIRAEARDSRRTIATAPPIALNCSCRELYFPVAKTLLTADIREGESCIHMLRFFDRRALSLCRGRLRFAGRCGTAMMEGAMESLAEAKAHHFALEGIYKTAMDFSSVNALSDCLVEEILSYL